MNLEYQVPLSNKEQAVIDEVLDQFKDHFDDLLEIEVFDANEDYVDFRLVYQDHSEDSMAVERDKILTAKDVKEIIYAIQ